MRHGGDDVRGCGGVCQGEGEEALFVELGRLMRHSQIVDN